MNQHFMIFFFYTVNWRTGPDHNRRETAVKHNQTCELLSNLSLLPHRFHHLIAHFQSEEVLIQQFYRDGAVCRRSGLCFFGCKGASSRRKSVPPPKYLAALVLCGLCGSLHEQLLLRSQPKHKNQ